MFDENEHIHPQNNDEGPRQALDEAVGVGQTGCGDALLVGGLQTAIADVLHDRAGE